ncbi:MAG TPA: hypothetical protein VLX67_05470 [Stellaceae bacterium]|nr:hypothetical protein [Stellaceae bacterium]
MKHIIQGVRVLKGRLAQGLLIGAILVAVSLLPSTALVVYTAYYLLVPRYASVAEFDRLGFNLRLEFYRPNEEVLDSGRYLTVINGGSYRRFMLEGWDWAHRARTSLYRIDDNRFAVLSPLGYDYVLTLKPVGFAPVVSDSGAQWQYLGAFDFVFPAGAKPRLEFFDNRSPECIPMGRGDPATWTGKPRPQARRATCPSPPPNLGE